MCYMIFSSGGRLSTRCRQWESSRCRPGRALRHASRERFSANGSPQPLRSMRPLSIRAIKWRRGGETWRGWTARPFARRSWREAMCRPSSTSFTSRTGPARLKVHSKHGKKRDGPNCGAFVLASKIFGTCAQTWLAKRNGFQKPLPGGGPVVRWTPE